jgi:hypothetical protein
VQLGEARKRRTATPEELTKKTRTRKSQKEHHHTRTLLDEHGIEWDKTYVF